MTARLFVLSIISLLLSACTHTWTWKEEVLLRTGEVIIVEPRITFKADEWGRSGRGMMDSHSIDIAHTGTSIQWTTTTRTGWDVLPVALDFVDGKPVVVMPVSGGLDCEYYGFPPEGLAVYIYNGGKWRRTPVSALPGDVRVNLFQRASAMTSSRDFTGSTVTLAAKRRLSQRPYAPLGADMATVSAAKRATKDACIRLRPPHFPEREAVRRRFEESELTAGVLSVTGLVRDEIGTLGEGIESPKNWWDVAYVKGCAGQIAAVDQVYGQDGFLKGYRLVRSLSGPGPTDIDLIPISALSVVCTKAKIFVLHRKHGKEFGVFAIHEFAEDGQHIGVVKFRLVDAAEYVGDAPYLWSIEPTNSELKVTFAEIDKGTTKRVRDYVLPIGR